MKYVFPAIFSPEDEGYSVGFPDIEGCYTCGDNLLNALEMAEDVLALMLCCMENENKEIPKPSPRDTLYCDKGSFVNDIYCDTTSYRKKISTKMIRKTVTIPEWLNETAKDERIDFSRVLQEALIEKLGNKKAL